MAKKKDRKPAPKEGTNSEQSIEEDVYDVEKIIIHRDVGAFREYYVKWVGYSDSENTWVDEREMSCELLVQEYWKGRRPSVLLQNICYSVGNEKEIKLSSLPSLPISCIESATRTIDGVLYKVCLCDNSFAIVDKGFLISKCPDLLLSFLESKLCI